MITRAINDARDAAVSLALRAFLNERFAEYGEVTACELDSAHDQLRIIARLAGERDPITIMVERYSVHSHDGQHYATIEAVSSSREWIGRLLQRLLAGQRYRVPSVVSRLL